jgi:N-formylglutamate amidohydrolase
MNRLTSEQRAAVISCLIEGNSVRSTVRITGVAKKTVMRLVFEVGTFCAEYQNRVFQNLLSASGCRLMSAGRFATQSKRT